MDRRRLVSLLGAVGIGGTAGCIRQIESRITNPGNRTVALVAQDEVDERHHLDIHVEMVEPTISSSQTARIRVTTANRGGKRALSVGSAPPCDIFNRSDGGSDDPPGLWLKPTGTTDSLGRLPGKWVRDRPQNKPRGFPAVACGPKGYEQDESVTTEYGIWHDYRVDGYLEPGTYRWEREVIIWEDREARETDTVSAAIHWGFSLSIELTR